MVLAGMQISNPPKIQAVIPLLLQLEKDKNDYLPEAVSIGPYHHGDPKLAFVEAFKPMAVDLFISGCPAYKELYYNRVLHIIGDVRNCYVQTSMVGFSDDYLAGMMLQDASLIIIFMETSAPAQEDDLAPVRRKIYAIKEHLGMLAYETLSRDLYLLNNQIPLFVVKLLIDSRDGVGRGDELVKRFLCMSFFGEDCDESLLQQFYAGKPLHLLEATHRLLIRRRRELDVEEDIASGAATVVRSGDDPEIGTRIGPEITTTNGNNGFFLGLKKLLARKSANVPNDDIKSLIPVYRAATDLKAKGIHFKRSPTKFWDDVNFKYHFFHARLRLPQFGVSTRSKVFLKNMVAYELSPNSPTNCEIVSFINLMKSLIERPEDVKELREKRILHNLLGSDEEVLSVFKEINTHGATASLFEDVNDEIQAHCNNRMKTSMGEFIHTYLRSPLTMIALLAAMTLLAISAAQLHYAVHRKKQ